MCYRTKLGRYRLNRFGVRRGSQTFWGCSVSKMTYNHNVFNNCVDGDVKPYSFTHSLITVRQLLYEICQKIDPSRSAFQGHSKSLEPRHRSIGNPFLLLFLVTMGLFPTFSEINSDFCRKSQLFPPRVFNAPLREFPSGICEGGSGTAVALKNYKRWCKEFDDMCIIQRVADRRTDLP